MADKDDDWLAKWMVKWREADFTWPGLRKHELQGWVVADGLLREAENGRVYGRPILDTPEPVTGAPATLQDYWRADPATGRLRSDEEMGAELVLRPGSVIPAEASAESRNPGDRAEAEPLGSGSAAAAPPPPGMTENYPPETYHLAHLPLTYADGTATGKEGRPDDALDAIVGPRLLAASETRWEGGGVVGPDRDAQFQGGVWLRAVNHTASVSEPLSLCYNMALIARDGDFSRRRFSGLARFRGAAFGGEAWFRGVTFSDTAEFSGASFINGAQFISASFTSGASFSHASFRGGARFDGSAFSGFADFERAVLRDARFDRTAFSGDAWFERATFIGDACFDHAAFGGAAEFEGAAFKGDAEFDGTAFGAAARFESASFGRVARFDQSAFSGDAWFERATFLGTARFEDAAFSGSTAFAGAAFCTALALTRCFFARNADFSGQGAPTRQGEIQQISLALSREGESAQLTGAMTQTDAPTPLARRAFPRIDAAGAVFAGDADFSDRDVLESPSSFAGARFYGLAAFHESALHQGVSFFGARLDEALKGTDVLPAVPEDSLVLLHAAENKIRALRNEAQLSMADWRKAYDAERAAQAEVVREARLAEAHANARSADPKHTPTDFVKWKVGRGVVASARYEALESCFRTLKLAMEENRNKIEEGRFFRLELLARAKRRDKDVPYWERVASWWYEKLADYGNSITRPLRALFWLFLIMSATFYCFGALLDAFASISTTALDATGAKEQAAVVARQIGETPLYDVYGALTFSWNNMFRPLSALTAEGVGPYEPSWASALLYGYGPGYGFGVRLLATLQSLLAIVLAFLFALAVRRRFQIS